LRALRGLGAGLAIDDFGTGCSSLAYLNRLPTIRLKIHRSFVGDMLHDPTERAITKAIFGLSHTLGLRVVTAGVERQREAALLREARFDAVTAQDRLSGSPALGALGGHRYARPLVTPAGPRCRALDRPAGQWGRRDQ
jgi:predicted signal transduction protein with EAL and GGDEF domain